MAVVAGADATQPAVVPMDAIDDADDAWLATNFAEAEDDEAMRGVQERAFEALPPRTQEAYAARWQAALGPSGTRLARAIILLDATGGDRGRTFTCPRCHKTDNVRDRCTATGEYHFVYAGARKKCAIM